VATKCAEGIRLTSAGLTTTGLLIGISEAGSVAWVASAAVLLAVLALLAAVLFARSDRPNHRLRQLLTAARPTTQSRSGPHTTHAPTITSREQGAHR
jgi:hypothetical protein